MSDWYTQTVEIALNGHRCFISSQCIPTDWSGFDWIKAAKTIHKWKRSWFSYDSISMECFHLIQSIGSRERKKNKNCSSHCTLIIFSLHDRFLFLMMILFVAALQIKWTFFEMKLTLSIECDLIRNRLNLAGIIRSIAYNLQAYALKLGTQQQHLRNSKSKSI